VVCVFPRTPKLIFIQVYAFGVLYFGLFCATGSIGAFLPTIIASMGYGKSVDAMMSGADSMFSERNGTATNRPAIYGGHDCSCLHGIYLR